MFIQHVVSGMIVVLTELSAVISVFVLSSEPQAQVALTALVLMSHIYGIFVSRLG